MTLEEFQIIKAIADITQSLDSMISTRVFDDTKTRERQVYVSSLAVQNGVKYNIAAGKILVPMPFGATLEEIALQYLGNADRWVEIATINNLKIPFIDEIGSNQSFLSNGEGSKTFR